MSDIRLLHGGLTAEKLLLHFSQRRAGLDQVDTLNTGCEGLKIPERLNTVSSSVLYARRVSRETHSQHIIHERSLPRSHLHQLYAAALASLRHPFCNCPDTNQLAKYLRNLRRRHEVTFLAEDLAVAFGSCRVVAAIRRGEDLAHERGDRNWAGDLDF